MADIAIVTAWYGPLPPWLPLTLRTMECNPSVDFLLIGDFEPPGYSVPPNVHLRALSRWELRTRIRRHLDLTLLFLKIRKLCDLKPTFGHLFAKELEPYSWWGWADLDVVYGDIRGRLSGLDMDRLDAISTYERHPSSGPLMLLRNAERTNALYRCSPDWRRALRLRRYVAFDEWWGDSGLIDFSQVLDSESQAGLRLERFQLMDDNRAYDEHGDVSHTTNTGKSCEWTPERLTAIDSASGLSNEVLYFHFMDWKGKDYFDQLSSLKERTDKLARFSLAEDELKCWFGESPTHGMTPLSIKPAIDSQS